MKNKYLTIALCLLAIMLPIAIFGQDTTAEVAKTTQFLKGDGAFEKWFMEVFQNLELVIGQKSAAVSLLGRTIGGFGALIYLGHLGWQMQEGARPWEVTPMLRPIFIGLILANWMPFTKLISAPFEELATPSTAIFQELEIEANANRVAMFEKQTKILDFLVKKRAEAEAKDEYRRDMEAKANQNIFEKIGDSVSNTIDKGMWTLTEPIKEWFVKTQFHLQKLAGDIIEVIALLILRVCVYFIFFIQKIWSFVLILLGPIAVGMALIPGFESSLTNWIAKFININLYTFVAINIITLGQVLIISGYKMVNSRYDEMLKGTDINDYTTLYMTVSNNGLIYVILPIVVAYIVTAIGILMTPTIADSIVSAGGSGIMAKGKSAGAAATKIGKAIASKGTSAVAGASKYSAGSFAKNALNGNNKNSNK